MKCNQCGGELYNTVEALERRANGRPVRIANVPLLMCENCRTVFLTQEQNNKVLMVIQAIKESEKDGRVTVAYK